MMDKLGEYEILEEIDRGRSVVIYKARHTTKRNCIVALKVIRPALTAEPESIERFKQEIHDAAGLDHPHIVKIYEFFDKAGQFHIAMEMAHGSSLAKRIQQHGPILWEEALDILEQTASALDYIHERGLVHRDVKPSNILLDLEKGVLLGGLGLSQAIGASDCSLTITAKAWGTVNYVAPEIWRGEQAVPASDVYALGCVLYEMVTGNVLFDAGSPWAVMKQHEIGPQLDATKVEKRFRQVLLKALEKSPQRRYQRAGEFVAALRGAAERPAMFGNALQRPETNRNWAYIALGLAALLSVVALLCRPLGWAAEFGDQPPSISAHTPTATIAATSIPTSTATITPTRTPTAAATHIALPSPSPSLAPTATRPPTHTPTNTPTPTSTPTWVPPVIPPELIAPARGETHQNPIAFRWSDALDSGQAYQVIVYHSSGNTIQSELLATQDWTVDLPGDLFGEWHWRVSVVSGGRETATSSEWTFWFDPFPDGGRTQPQPTSEPAPPTFTPPP